jgi:deoxyribodipyrimidine photolyase
MNIFWFRRDLRLEDNVGLFHALQSGESVLPIFIFDEDILAQLPKDDARVTFIHQQLEKIQNQLLEIGKSLAVFHGKPMAIFQQLIAENKITTPIMITNLMLAKEIWICIIYLKKITLHSKPVKTKSSLKKAKLLKTIAHLMWSILLTLTSGKKTLRRYS